jgi:iron complex transport system permease protein
MGNERHQYADLPYFCTSVLLKVKRHCHDCHVLAVLFIFKVDFMEKKNTSKYTFLLIAGICLVIIIFMLNIMLGSVNILPHEILNCLFAPENADKTHLSIILNIRLPRTLAAFAGGAALSVSGVLLQIFFGNPIVEPYILGVSSGSNLFLGIVILGGYTFGLSHITSMGMFAGSFIGAMAVMLLVIAASQKVKSITSLLIIGLMLGYICSAATSVLTVIADKERLMGFTLRTMGSFSGFTWEQVKILYIVAAVFLIAAFLMSKPLNAMLLGERYAQSMGISIRSFRFAMVLVSSVLTSVVTAFAGTVSFIGLAVPHIVRITFKTSDNRIVIPAAAIYGAAFTGLCDMGARLLLSPTELPLSAVTTVVGAPVALYLLLRKKGGEA